MMGAARECFVITVPRSAVVMAHAVTAFSPPMQILRMVGLCALSQVVDATMAILEGKSYFLLLFALICWQLSCSTPTPNFLASL